MNGGELIARALAAEGTQFLFTLCGGHISPILVSAKGSGIRVVDVRDEVTAVFAADAVARLTGRVGVAAVTAGPGVTNTITAIKNSQLAQVPVVLLGGATGTILKGRGALQDIDQLALMRPHVKWAVSVSKVRDLPGIVAEAFRRARAGVPGPVFVECPVDLLYDEDLVRRLYGEGSSDGGIRSRLQNWYLRRHVDRLFAGAQDVEVQKPLEIPAAEPGVSDLRKAAAMLARAERAVTLIGSQALLDVAQVDRLAAAVRDLEVPCYLSGMARGLLGAGDPVQVRHRRRESLREADLVILAGVPCDFRLDYGRQIGSGAKVISVNRSGEDLKKNRRPDLGVKADPGRFLIALADLGAGTGTAPGAEWLQRIRQRDDERETEIARKAAEPTGLLNPLALCRAIDDSMDDDSVVVVDGGDFVATASYVVAPRGPLRWLDPGSFGTLGVGAGFALGAVLARPDSEVWILYGDGSAAYSLAEFDTFVRHEIPVIAVVGNDASWAQIAREQIEILGDDVGTVLRRTDYQTVAEGYGGVGLLLERPEDTLDVLAEARILAAAGKPVLINAHLGTSDFRKGSISM